MPAHAKVVDRRQRAIRLWTVAFVWLCGLAAGFCAFLAAAARYGCVSGDQGMACTTSGSVLGFVLLAAVIAVVVVVTLATTNGAARRVLFFGGFGVLALGICAVVAGSLLSTA